MILTPLIERDEIQKAYETFSDSMRKGSMPFTRTLGWKSDNTVAEVFWNDTLGIWSHFDRSDPKNRYWCVFGVENASEPSPLKITCEINIPKEKIDHRVAGLFVRDNKGNVYITHNGNLGGGREGISGTNFRTFFQRDDFVDIAWQDKHESETILIGRIDDPELPYLIKHFVKKVNSFKERVASGGERTLTSKEFSPEFSGPRSEHMLTDKIKSRCNHGIVINSLHNLLESNGLKTANDNKRDLFIDDDIGNMKMLFEAKTDTSTSSIYGAIGQLMYHAAVQDTPPKCVLVVPDKPKANTVKILNKLGIQTLSYKLDKGKALFPEVEAVLKEAKT
jgi:hypothetical protein